MDGIFLLGTTGEGPSLGHRLRRELVSRACSQVRGRASVLVGVTDTAFVETVALARHAADAGADALVIAPPYYMPQGQPELREYLGHLLPELPLLITDGAMPLALPGTTRLPGSTWALEAELAPRHAVPDKQLIGTRGWEAYLDAAVVGTSPRLRRRRPGDRFCPLGMEGRSTRVNEFMINEKIPAVWRDHVPLLVNAKDEIVWVCGWRPDERARVREATQQVGHFSFVQERTSG